MMIAISASDERMRTVRTGHHRADREPPAGLRQLRPDPHPRGQPARSSTSSREEDGLDSALRADPPNPARPPVRDRLRAGLRRGRCRWPPRRDRAAHARGDPLRAGTSTGCTPPPSSAARARATSRSEPHSQPVPVATRGICGAIPSRPFPAPAASSAMTSRRTTSRRSCLRSANRRGEGRPSMRRAHGLKIAS